MNQQSIFPFPADAPKIVIRSASSFPTARGLCICQPHTHNPSTHPDPLIIQWLLFWVSTLAKIATVRISMRVRAARGFDSFFAGATLSGSRGGRGGGV